MELCLHRLPHLLHVVHTDNYIINEVFSNSNYTSSLPNLKYYPDTAWRYLVFAESEVNPLAYEAVAPAAGLGYSVTKAVNSDATVNEANRYNCISSHHTHNYTTLHAWMLNCLRFHVNCKRPSKVILCIWQAVSSADLLPFNSLILSQRTAFWDDGYVIYM